MAVNYGRLRSVAARDMIRRVTVTFHKPSDTFPPKTLKSMITQARWTEEDLKRLKLLR